MATKGYDLFITNAGAEQTMHCRVCKAPCKVRRNVYGPTGFVSAMAKRFTVHDSFVCPHADEDWHRQALRLVMAIEQTPSPRVAQLMQQDLQDLLSQHNTL